MDQVNSAGQTTIRRNVRIAYDCEMHNCSGRQACAESQNHPNRFCKVQAAADAILMTWQTPTFQFNMLQWCQLVCSWLLFKATGSDPSAPEIPILTRVPEDFKALPDYLLSDVECIVSWYYESGLLTSDERANVAIIVKCFAVFLSSQDRIGGVYLRRRLSSMLYKLMPNSAATQHLKAYVSSRTVSYHDVYCRLSSAVMTLKVPCQLLTVLNRLWGLAVYLSSQDRIGVFTCGDGCPPCCTNSCFTRRQHSISKRAFFNSQSNVLVSSLS
jgi:hypothetical protein